MNKIETFHFMEKIKAYYQNFSIEKYVLNEWADKLKPYDINDVYRKLDEHLNGEYKNEIPKLHFITKYLKTPTEKQKTRFFQVLCPNCGGRVNLNDYTSHISRHNSIFYIKKNESRIGKRFDEDKLFKLSDEEFSKLYDCFLEKLYDVSDGNEKHRIGNIILSKNGLSIQLTKNDISK